MPDRKKILLTGGNGFLGSNLLRKLVALDFQVLITVRASSDLSRIEDLKGRVRLLPLEKTDFAELFRGEKVGAVVHCATDYGRKQTSPLSILEANLLLPLRLLQLGSENGLPCFINTDTILDKGVSHYSLSKAQFKDWLKLYSDKMACVNVALEHFYGPYDDESKFAAWVTHALIRGVPRLDLTPGGQRRDFVYIDDTVEALSAIILHEMTAAKKYVSYEVGSGQPVSIREFVETIKRLAGNDCTQLNFGALPYREKEVMESKADLALVKSLGWLPKVSLAEGLERTITLEKRRAGK